MTARSASTHDGQEAVGDRGAPHSAAGARSDVTTGRLSISVVVPVRNEERFIEQTLRGLLDQNYPADAMEILVVDGQSDDATPRLVAEWAARDPRIQLLHNPRRLASAARNIGARHSTGDVVLVVDGHCQLTDRDYLSRVADAFQRWSVDAVGRPQPLDVQGATALQRAIAAARQSPLGHHPDSYIYSSTERIVPAHSVAVAYRSAVFDRIGFFDERFDACEDVEFNHRLDKSGLRCVLAPAIALKYHPRSTLRDLFHQMVRYGRGRCRLLVKHPDTFSWKTLAPAALVVAMAVSLFAPWWPSPLAALAAAGWLTYIVTVLATSLYLAFRDRDLATLAWLPAVFATIHVGAGWGLLSELASILAVGFPELDDEPASE